MVNVAVDGDQDYPTQRDCRRLAQRMLLLLVVEPAVAADHQRGGPAFETEIGEISRRLDDLKRSARFARCSYIVGITGSIIPQHFHQRGPHQLLVLQLTQQLLEQRLQLHAEIPRMR